MRNVVAFLLEHFADVRDIPQPQDLGELLEDAGFEYDDISDALTCVHLLDELPEINQSSLHRQQPALRVYHIEELEILSTEIRGLLHFLEHSGTINAMQREYIIHALMHLPYDNITLENAKVLALLVLWAHRSELPVLIGDELMSVLHGKSTMQ
ncbi:DUF494 domain-containing protein [Kingella kingae]|uniref:DUF494 family protein n=1 Tax=Kingella kingae TaxID=504 RepID=UPI00025855A1|nr:DUF494 domain-containing protein [Kingella kingae]EIC12632.1 Smg protein [Kingella kingae PYKK081]MBD3614567.1 DUF494 domain-containing protein [Kingella kingae]MBD3632900.1 DUF494 domain-containing protein [Kingella kingae]MBD3660210.1 DUF494 domain-containing protein [Kingella kingae]MDK4544597.1 DUF494 domain-containing protein [Kingella kingae]